jgi:hypothetical protein
MKRTILGLAGVVTALVLMPGDAAAQRPFRVGVIGGVNMSNLSGDDAEDTGSKIGFDVGGLLQIPVGEIVTIQPEVHYSQRGAEFDGPGDLEAEISLDYIHVPILLRAGVPLAEGFDFDFEVGPSFGFLMSCDFEGEDCKEDSRTIDMGIIAGGGFSWAMGAGDLLVDIRYDLGLTSISDPEDDADEADLKNTNLQFLIGYAFPM